MSFTLFRPGRGAGGRDAPEPAPAAPRPKPLMWALVDCQSFYCSCERLFRPDLEGRPVVVLSNNDGCLIALTPEAKALGFKLGDVHFEVERHLKRHKVTVFSSNYTLYGDISQRVMRTMETVVPEIDQYSIDEAFVPFDRVLAGQAEDVGWALHDRVRRWVGVPVRVGIGPTRTLAKLANHRAKKLSRVLKFELGSPELESTLAETPTVDVWGIGRRMSDRLERLGITNARQLRDMELGRAKKYLTVIGQRTVLELRGVQCILEEPPAPRQTLVSSRSFGHRTTRKEDLAQALAMHCAIAGQRLRTEGLEASSMQVWVLTSRHSEDEPYVSLSAHVHLPLPTNITGELIAASAEALDRCYQPGHGFMKGGIMLYNLAEAARRQMTLMEAAVGPAQQKARDLMRALDTVNDRYGRDALRYAAQGPAEADWHMRREKMSGLFTTRWADLAKART